MNHHDVPISSSSTPASSTSSSSLSTAVPSSLSSLVTSGVVDLSHDVIHLPRSVHKRLLQELCAGKTKLRAMDNLQKLFRGKVVELERTREHLENCQGALLRCERRLCDVIAQQMTSFRSRSSASNSAGINNCSVCGRQDHAEWMVEGHGKDTPGEDDRAKGADASTNNETEMTSLEKPSLTYPQLGLASDQFPKMAGRGSATEDWNDVASAQLRKMTKVVNEAAPASVSFAMFSASPDKTSRKMMQNRICLNLNHRPTLTNTIAKYDSPGAECESLTSSTAKQTNQLHPGLGQWQSRATPNFSPNTTNLACQRSSVSVSKDLLSKLIQQNARLKTTMKQLLGHKGITITQYLDTQEQLDIIEQLRQELRLAKIRIQHMEEREKIIYHYHDR